MIIGERTMNVYRLCMDCGYDSFEPEVVLLHEDGRRQSYGYTTCPKCSGEQFCLFGYKDKSNWPGMDKVKSDIAQKRNEVQRA